MKKTIREYVEQNEDKLLFSQYIKMVQMFVMPDTRLKVNSIKLNIADLIIMGNEEPEKMYKRINYALKHKLISSKQKIQRFYEFNEKYMLYDYEDKYKNTNYFISAPIFPIIFFKNDYYPKDLHIDSKNVLRYKDLNRYLFDVLNIPYIDYELCAYYYKRGINVYDKETLKQNCRIVTCIKNKLY